ncbi:MAG: exo-alpha-sialidase [Thermaerobacter sp.]|nr:exo-alpha-sialidase [Thermaerobacter sp.]
MLERLLAVRKWVAGGVVLGVALSLFVILRLVPDMGVYPHRDRSIRWEAERNLTTDAGQSHLSVNFARSMAIDKYGGVHVVWFDNRHGEPRVYYRQSKNGGLDWESERQISGGPFLQEQPSIAASGSAIFVVWHDGRHGGHTVYLRKSNDRGLTWEPEQRISSTNGSAYPSVAASGSHVYVIWGDVRDGQTEVYLRVSTDGGTSWGSEARISSTPWDSWVPTIAASGDNVYVAWVDAQDGNEEQYFRQSANRGATWGQIRRLTEDDANSWASTLAVDRETVHLVWFDQKDSPVQPLKAELKLAEAMRLLGLQYEPGPAGVVVTLPEEAAQRRITEKMQLVRREESVWIRRGGDAARLNAIMTAFDDLGRRNAPAMARERKLNEALALMNIVYSPSSPPTDLPRGDHDAARRQRIADMMWQIQEKAPSRVAAGGDSSRLDAVLREFRRMRELSVSEWEIYHMRSLDGGLTWSPATRLTDAPGGSQRPSVAISGEHVVVAWFDYRHGESEVYFKESLDAGQSWEPEVRLTTSPGPSILPTIATFDGRVHVLWSDGRDGNAEIYYKRRK